MNQYIWYVIDPQMYDVPQPIYQPQPIYPLHNQHSQIIMQPPQPIHRQLTHYPQPSTEVIRTESPYQQVLSNSNDSVARRVCSDLIPRRVIHTENLDKMGHLEIKGWDYKNLIYYCKSCMKNITKIVENAYKSELIRLKMNKIIDMKDDECKLFLCAYIYHYNDNDIEDINDMVISSIDNILIQNLPIYKWQKFVMECNYLLPKLSSINLEWNNRNESLTLCIKFNIEHLLSNEQLRNLDDVKYSNIESTFNTHSKEYDNVGQKRKIFSTVNDEY